MKRCRMRLETNKIPLTLGGGGGQKQRYEGESGLLGNEIFYKVLEYIYNNKIQNDNRNINKILMNNKPFYCKEYSDNIYLKSDVDAVYTFVKKKYQFFQVMKERFTTMKKKEKYVKVDKKNQYLMVKNRKKFGSFKTHYLFSSHSDHKKLKLKFRVPYWYLFSNWNRDEIRNIFRGIKNVIKGFDEIYQEYYL